MTIVMPVFFVIVNVSIVSSVSIFNSVEQVSVSCNASFARNVSIVCNCIVSSLKRRAIWLEKCAFLSPRKHVVSCGCQLKNISIWRTISII